MNYHSFIIAEPSDAKRIVAAEGGGQWRLSVHDDPSKRHWGSTHGTSTFERAEFVPQSPEFYKTNRPCHEILIDAEDEDVAHNVQSLIHGGIVLAYPAWEAMRKANAVIAAGSLPDDILADEYFGSRFVLYENAAFGCDVAARAWRHTEIIYAVEKYMLSLSLDWFTPHSASPRHGQLFANEHPEYTYHVHAAFAIIAAFSVIEELGLEVRSSQVNPRFIEDDEWNPKVQANLAKRLQAAGIDPTSTFDWLHRGSPTKVENELSPKFGEPSKYADGKDVRDRTITLMDAIHYASFLRNYMASHRFKEVTAALSPYDVHNVQILARRLILGRLRLWRSDVDANTSS